MVGFKDRLHLQLHRLQCRRLPPTERDATAAALARDLRFIGTLWHKRTRTAALLGVSGRKEAEAAGFATVAEWLRRVIFPDCFRSAIADIEKPTRHRFGRQWLKDESGRIAEIAPIDLPLPRLKWWLVKETMGRSAPILRDLLEANASSPGSRAHAPDRTGESPAANERAEDETAEHETERNAALLRALYSLCDPTAGGPLRPRQRLLLSEVLEGATTSELERILDAPSRGALYTALSRLRAKLPEDLRAAFDRGRFRRKRKTLTQAA